MKLRTILTLPGASFREKWSRIGELLALKIASWLPQRIRYWSTILEIGKATSDSSNVPATPLDEVLRNLEK